jgi:hypothetical protein
MYYGHIFSLILNSLTLINFPYQILTRILRGAYHAVYLRDDVKHSLSPCVSDLLYLMSLISRFSFAHLHSFELDYTDYDFYIAFASSPVVSLK